MNSPPERLVQDSDPAEVGSLALDLGKRIKDRRERLGISQAELGARLKTTKGGPIPATQVSKWERGEFLPSRAFWPQLAAALDTPLDGLFRDLIPNEGADLLLDRVETLEVQINSLMALLSLRHEVDTMVRAQRSARSKTYRDRKTAEELAQAVEDAAPPPPGSESEPGTPGQQRPS